MSQDLVVLKLDAARQALAEAKTLQQTKSVLDVAAAAEVYARRQKLGDDAVKYATDIRLDAERKLGAILRETPNAKPGPRPELRSSEEHNSAPSLDDLGIDRKTSMRAQRLAELPDESFEAVKSGKVAITEALRQQRQAELPARVAALPEGKYRVVYADPPWKYNDARAFDAYGATAAADHYPTMSVEELCALPVKDLLAPESVLFCWATFPLLPDALTVVSSWGFTYKTAIVWEKDRANFGNYHNATAELLLIATRGSCTPDGAERAGQVQRIARGRHSAKPEEFRTLIDTLYRHGPRIELFRRGEAPPGWVVWGNEAQAA